MNAVVTLYRGSKKHKNRPGRGAKGTLCPEWTHATSRTGLGNDPSRHAWPETEAHRLFENAEPDPDGRERRYATARGIAFEAKPSNDGTWHGYPIPWESVPDAITDQWLAHGTINRRQVKQHRKYPKNDIHWALDIGT